MMLKHVYAAFLVLVSLPAFAGVEQVGETQVRFAGTGPAGLRLEGKTNMMTLHEEGATVSFTVPLKTLETGIALRDKHMKERYLEVDRYPQAVLMVPWSAVRLPEPGRAHSQVVTGTLTLHGQSREVQVRCDLKHNGDRYEVRSQVPINMKDFGIETPRYMGLSVKPDIETVVTFSFKKD